MKNSTSVVSSFKHPIDQQAEQAQQDGQYLNASKLWQRRIQKTGKPMYARQHVKCLIQADERMEADEYCRVYAERWPRIRFFPITRLKLAYQQSDWEKAEHLWKQLASINEDKDTSALKIIQERVQAKDYSGAVHAAEQAMLYWHENEQLSQRHNYLQYHYGSQPELSLSFQQHGSVPPELASSAGESFLAIMQYADNAENEAVIPLLVKLLQRWPDFKPAIDQLMKCWQKEGLYQEIIDYCQHRVEKRGCYERRIISRWTVALLALNRLDEAMALVGKLDAQDKAADMVQHLLINSISQGLTTKGSLYEGLATLSRQYEVSGLEYAEAFEAQLRPLQRSLIESFDITEPVVASTRIPSQGMVILFTGYARRVGSMPQRLLDRYMAGHGFAVVRLIDKSGCLYLDGMPELGGSFEATVDALRQMADEYGTSRIVTIGNSGGGMGALRYGVALNASHVVAFSPAVNLSLDFMENHSDYRARATIRKLNRLYKTEDLDVRRFIERKSFTGRMDVYAGANNPEDQYQIRHLEGLQNVHLHDVEGVSSHNSIGRAVLDGTFLTALQRVVS